MRLVKHANTMELIEVYESSKYVHLVLPLMEGGDLIKRMMSLKTYNEETAIKAMRSFLDGLDHCHALNIVHRDLKPENLLLHSKSNDWDMKIADFGLSCIYKGRGLTVKCGTPGFIAPEILGDKPYDLKSDVFSAGIILYMLLSGRHPFHAKNRDALLQANLQSIIDFDDSKLWGHISDQAKDLVQKMLAKEPDQRISVREALQHPWMN